MSHAVLTAHDLWVRKGTGRAAFELRIEKLALHAAETLVVLGPNGAGKSTLLRALAGLEIPRSGRIEHPPHRLPTMVFQRPVAFDGTLEHNVRAALLGRRLAREEIRTRVNEALERFGLARFRNRRAATLSGGELRRLALARAFSVQPPVLLLDEPFDDLDGTGQEALSLDLRRAIGQTRVAVCFVTHDLRRAMLLADRIAILIQGEIVQIDRCEMLLAHPVTPTVARLVGMVNLIPGVVVDSKQEGFGVVRIDAGHEIPVPVDLPAGTSVTLGIRPEHLGLATDRGRGVPIGKATVRHVVSDGLITAVTLEFVGHAIRSHVVAGRGLARSLSPGDQLNLSIHPHEIHVMSPESE